MAGPKGGGVSKSENPCPCALELDRPPSQGGGRKVRFVKSWLFKDPMDSLGYRRIPLGELSSNSRCSLNRWSGLSYNQELGHSQNQFFVRCVVGIEGGKARFYTTQRASEKLHYFNQAA